MADLIVSISHDAAEEFCNTLADYAIKFEDRTTRPKQGEIFASGSEILNIACDPAQWAALAAVIIAWINANSRRKVMITTHDYKVIQVEGMSPEEVDRVLKSAHRVTMLEIPKKKSKKKSEK